MSRTGCGAIAAFFVLALPAHAEVLSFEDAARMALQGNPDLFTLRYQEEALNFRSHQALSPANPVFSVTKNDLPGLSPASIGASTSYGLAMNLGFPGKALLQSSMSRHQAESFSEQSRAKEIDILSALSINYVSLAINDRIYDFLSEEEKRSQDLIHLIERKYAAAQVAQVDLLNAKVFAANLKHELLVNRDDHQLLLTQFRNIISRPGTTEFEPALPRDVSVPDLGLTFAELKDRMLRNRHLLLASERQVDAAQSAVTAASIAALPDFQLSAAINIYHVAAAEVVPGISRDYTLGLGLTVPIFFPFNELSGMRAARRDRDSAEAQLDSARRQAISDLEAQYTRFVANLRETDNLEKLVLPAARASYDLTLKSYSLGRSDYLRLHDARGGWVQAQKDLLQKKLTGAQLFILITQQVGCEFTSQKKVFHACQ